MNRALKYDVKNILFTGKVSFLYGIIVIYMQIKIIIKNK